MWQSHEMMFITKCGGSALAGLKSIRMNCLSVALGSEYLPSMQISTQVLVTIAGNLWCVNLKPAAITLSVIIPVPRSFPLQATPTSFFELLGVDGIPSIGSPY